MSLQKNEEKKTPLRVNHTARTAGLLRHSAAHVAIARASEAKRGAIRRGGVACRLRTRLHHADLHFAVAHELVHETGRQDFEHALIATTIVRALGVAVAADVGRHANELHFGRATRHADATRQRASRFALKKRK